MEEELTPWQKYKQSLGETRPWDLLKSDTKYVDDEIQQSRFNICLQCPELISLTKQCKKCGCFMSAKTKLEKAVCPLGKW